MLVRDNRYIPEEDRDFFILLRAGLWQKAEEPLSDSPDWEYIYTIACEQTVQGIVADGITIVKAAYGQGRFDTPFPTGEHWQDVYDKFLSAVAQIVRRNHQINQKQAEICQLFQDAYISYVIIKGQGVARCYPKPMLRCSGDIDYLFDGANYQMARSKLMRYTKGIIEDDKDKHIGMLFGNIEVELHGVAKSYFANCMDNALETERERMLREKDFTYYEFNGTKISLPSVHYHVIFLMYHILRHLTHSGIGIRQICDLAIFLNAYNDQIEKYWLNVFLQKSGFQRHWNFFVKLCQDLLALPHDKAYYSHPHGISQHLQSFFVARTSDFMFPSIYDIWLQCKRTGNMGHKTASVFEYTSNTFIGRNKRALQQAHDKFKRNFSLYPKQATIQLFDVYMIFIRAAFRKIFRFM